MEVLCFMASTHPLLESNLTDAEASGRVGDSENGSVVLVAYFVIVQRGGGPMCVSPYGWRYDLYRNTGGETESNIVKINK